MTRLAALILTLLAVPAQAQAPPFEAMRAATVVVNDDAQGHGAGIVIAANRVLTAWHVVADDGSYTIRFYGAREDVAAAIAWKNVSQDVAVLDVVTPVAILPVAADCAGVVLGQEVWTIGHPMNLSWILTAGIVATDVLSRDGHDDMAASLTLDLTGTSGVSGGGVFNATGDLVGLMDAVFQRPALMTPFGVAYDEFGLTAMVPAKSFCASLQRYLPEFGGGPS